VPKVIPVETGFKHPIQTYRERGFLVSRPLPVKPGRLGALLKIMTANKPRNDIIVNCALQAYRKGRATVVFSDYDEGHLGILRRMLIQAGVKPSDIGLFSGSFKPKSKLDEQKGKPLVLATYGMCQEGIDYPRWDTGIMGTPRSQVKQIIGRFLREHDDKAHPVFFDLVDSDIRVLQNYYAKRYEQYMELGADIVR
jgi:superfamily II DNA or RNA helicase